MEQLKQSIKNKIELAILELEQLDFYLKSTQSNIDKVNHQLETYKKHLAMLDEPEIVIKLSDYIPQDVLDSYNPVCEMLFEEMNLLDWLDWFFEELPFIENKHLVFRGVISNKLYQLSELPNLPVKVDYLSRMIYIEPDEPIEIDLNGISLFKLLCV